MSNPIEKTASADASPVSGRFDPTAVLRPERYDSIALLVLWAARKAFLPLIWVGLAIAVTISQDPTDLGARLGTDLGGISSPSQAINELLSPLAGVVIAIGLRFLVGFVALGFAFGVTRATSVSDYEVKGRWRAHFRMWKDRIHMTRSLRALRWLWVVRSEAARRLGRTGDLLVITARVVSWANPVLFVVLIVVIVASG